MRLRPFSSRVDSLNKNQCSNVPPVPLRRSRDPRGPVYANATVFKSDVTGTRNYPSPEWQDCVLCYDYRHS